MKSSFEDLTAVRSSALKKVRSRPPHCKNHGYIAKGRPSGHPLNCKSI